VPLYRPDQNVRFPVGHVGGNLGRRRFPTMGVALVRVRSEMTDVAVLAKLAQDGSALRVCGEALAMDGPGALRRCGSKVVFQPAQIPKRWLPWSPRRWLQIGRT
jgi:hypothetical protein